MNSISGYEWKVVFDRCGSNVDIVYAYLGSSCRQLRMQARAYAGDIIAEWNDLESAEVSLSGGDLLVKFTFLSAVSEVDAEEVFVHRNGGHSGGRTLLVSFSGELCRAWVSIH